GVALGRLHALEHGAESRNKMIADQAIKEQDLAAELGRTADPAEKGRIVARLDEAKARTARLQAERAQAPHAIHEALEQVAGTREDYLQTVVALRKAVDVATTRREDIGDEVQARREILRFFPGEKGAQYRTVEQIQRR